MMLWTKAVIVVAVTVVVTCNVPLVEAATWSVERDSSGDYSVIQDAVDAAASGDTIMIGPGRYDEFRTMELSGAEWDIYVYVQTDSLTFIGSGRDVTIVGPEDSSVNRPGYTEIFTCAVGHMTISNVSLGNVPGHAIVIVGDSIRVENCQLYSAETGIYAKVSSGGAIRDCDFYDISERGVRVFPETNDLDIVDCVFENVVGGVWVSWSGSQNVSVRNCSFLNGVVGVQFADGATGAVTGCRFENQTHWGIAFFNSGAVSMTDCRIDVQGEAAGVWLANSGLLTAEDNVIASEWACAVVDYYVPLNMRNNEFQRKGSSWLVTTSGYYPWDPVHVDLRSNWWGTSDPEEIAAWINDGHDQENDNVFIDFEPFLSEPVGVEAPPRVKTLDLEVYPNPFNPRTEIAFNLESSANVQLELFDLRGRLVRSLVHRDYSAGRHAVSWDGVDNRGRAVPSGRYLAHLRADGETARRSMTLVR